MKTREINVLTGQGNKEFSKHTYFQKKTAHWITDSIRGTYIRTDGPKF